MPTAAVICTSRKQQKLDGNIHVRKHEPQRQYPCQKARTSMAIFTSVSTNLNSNIHVRKHEPQWQYPCQKARTSKAISTSEYTILNGNIHAYRVSTAMAIDTSKSTNLSRYTGQKVSTLMVMTTLESISCGGLRGYNHVRKYQLQ